MPNELLPITTIMLTHRSDERFIKALASIQWSSQIILVDNMSGNNWKELAKTYRFELLTHHDEITDFSQMRNTAIDKAKNTWVFFIDSDEEFDATSIKELKPIISGSKWEGATVVRRDIFHGKSMHWGESTQRILRLGRKKVMKYARPIHEIATISGSIKQSSILLWHRSHPNISEFIHDIAHYSSREGVFRSENQHQKFQLWQLIFYPPAKFFVQFVLKLGFLDGWHGLVYALVMSIHSAGVRIKQYELAQN